MGDSSLPAPADVVAFINAAEQHAAEVNGPYPIVDFLEADGMLLKRIGEKQEPRLQANRTGVGHPLDEEVAGIRRWSRDH